MFGPLLVTLKGVASASEIPLLVHATGRRLMNALVLSSVHFRNASLGNHISKHRDDLAHSFSFFLSIKRRSAFTSHLRKHNLDPLTLDIDDFAPAQSPMSVKSTSRKSIRGSTAESLPVQPHNTAVKNQFSEESYNRMSLHKFHPSSFFSNEPCSRRPSNSPISTFYPAASVATSPWVSQHIFK